MLRSSTANKSSGKQLAELEILPNQRFEITSISFHTIDLNTFRAFNSSWKNYFSDSIKKEWYDKWFLIAETNQGNGDVAVN